MSLDDLASIQAYVQQRVAAALAADAATGAHGPESATGSSDDGEVSVDVDGKGFVTQVRFDPAIADLDADQLREATLQAVRAAHTTLRPNRPTTDPTTALHDTSVDAAYRDLFDRLAAQRASGTRPEGPTA